MVLSFIPGGLRSFRFFLTSCRPAGNFSIVIVNTFRIVYCVYEDIFWVLSVLTRDF